MRDDAARALRVDDELPRHQVELRSVDSIEDAYADLRARASERRFERTPHTAEAAAVALQEPAAEPRREPVRLPRTAPGRSYGAHRREDPYTPSRRISGPQPGRRTIEITGQVQAPRRRSQTSAAFVARPDRAALWAFLLALFMVLMAVATAHAGV
jgi:hypothetical protein